MNAVTKISLLVAGILVAGAAVAAAQTTTSVQSWADAARNIMSQGRSPSPSANQTAPVDSPDHSTVPICAEGNHGHHVRSVARVHDEKDDDDGDDDGRHHGESVRAAAHEKCRHDGHHDDDEDDDDDQDEDGCSHGHGHGHHASD